EDGIRDKLVTGVQTCALPIWLAQTHKTVFPAAGVIPDAETAKSIALAVAIPIWGKDTVTSEMPLRAGLRGKVWTVIGNPHLHGRSEERRVGKEGKRRVVR